MITLILFLLVIILLVIEAFSLWGGSRRLEVEFDLDTTLVEPGEVDAVLYRPKPAASAAAVCGLHAIL